MIQDNITDEELGEMNYPELMHYAQTLPACDDPEVFRQQRFSLLARWQAQRILLHNWVGDFVSDPRYPYGLNAHTHGITETLNHPDFQVVLNVNPGTIEHFFNLLVERIKAGEKFEAGKEYDGLVQGMKLTFIEVLEQDRTVLRLIFPDENGELSRETNELADQYAEIE